MSDTNSQPVIEVAINLDATTASGVTVDNVVVIIDGKPQRPIRYCAVTNGDENATKVGLRDDAWDRTREGSPAYTELLDCWYASAENNAENDDFTGVAQCVQPGIERARNLNPELWLQDSEPGSPTRKAAHAALALALFHTSDVRESGANPLDVALEWYSIEVPEAPDHEFADLLTDLLTGLRHLAVAYGIRLESEPAPDALLAMDLRAMLTAIRYAATYMWNDSLAEAGTTLQAIEYKAFQAWLTDCTTE